MLTRIDGEGDDAKQVEKEVENIINNPEPAWKKLPGELEDKDFIIMSVKTIKARIE